MSSTSVFHLFKRFILDCWYYIDPLSRLQRSGAQIGKNVFIGHHTYIELENATLLHIEDDVTISAHTKIILHDSSLNNIANFPIKYGKVLLRKNCYIGMNTVVLAGSEVGKNTIVGANALVKGKLKANSVYVGQPAKWYCSVADLKKKWQKKNEPLTFLKSQPKWHKMEK